MTNLQQHQRHWKIFFLTSIFILIGLLSFPSTLMAKASKQLESLIKQRKWNKVSQIVNPGKDTALRNQVYMVRDFLNSGDNCIKDPENLTCYESTVMKWKKLAIDLTQKSHFSNEFDRYLVDQTRVLKERVKPIQRARWERKKQLEKQLESLIKQRQWDEVFKMIADKDATFYNRLYLTREFFDARDNCIKNPDIACYEETMTKWEELATNLNKWSPFSRKFSIYLNSLNDAFKAKIKPTYEAQIKKQEEARMKREKAREADLKTYRERANSDDAKNREEAFFHAEARALIILHVKPNKLRVGGWEFRVKRNPVGKGCFVYDPRTRFYGVERNLVWWVPKEDKAYPLNSPSKMVTPGLKWPREEGVDAPSTSEVIDYVFEGKPMTAIASSARPSVLKADSYKVKEYRIYRAVISTPMSVPEAQALENVAKRYGVTVEETKKTAKKVQVILFRNKWYGSPDSEIRHASDWSDRASPPVAPATPLLADEFEGVQYTIIDSSRLLNIKCSLDIRLQQKVSKEFLKRLALKLRADEPRSYERMFIVYLLPGMIPGAGAWATTHFNPNLKVEILGMTIEEEKKLKTKSKAPVSDIIGEWLDETPFIGGKTTILKKNGKILMIREFKDGSSSEKEMIQKQKSGKLRFEEKSGNDFGEYYLIDGRGRLAVYDDDGLINTMQPIK